MQSFALETTPSKEIVVGPSPVSAVHLRFTFPGYRAFAEISAHDVLAGLEETVWADFQCLVLRVTGLLPSWDPRTSFRMVTAMKRLASEVMMRPSPMEIALFDVLAEQMARGVMGDWEVEG